MLRLQSVSPGLKAVWVQISSPRTVHCPPSPLAHTTKSLPTTTTTTTTTCSSTPSARALIPHLSSLPQAALPVTNRPTTMELRPPPISATTTTPPCPYSLRPAPMVAPFQGQSALPSYPRRRRCLRPTASLSFGTRLPPLHRHCPPPQSQLPTSPGWEGCPSWCPHRTRPGLSSNTCPCW